MEKNFIINLGLMLIFFVIGFIIARVYKNKKTNVIISDLQKKIEEIIKENEELIKKIKK